jgi:hypothetical protein
MIDVRCLPLVQTNACPLGVLRPDWPQTKIASGATTIDISTAAIVKQKIDLAAISDFNWIVPTDFR